jgi:hypothetical protein
VVALNSASDRHVSMFAAEVLDLSHGLASECLSDISPAEIHNTSELTIADHRGNKQNTYPTKNCCCQAKSKVTDKTMPQLKSQQIWLR